MVPLIPLLFATPFAGSAVCAGCHVEQAKTQLTSAHAKALTARDGGRWDFGSGLQAVTPVSRLDSNTYLEHGLSFYKALNREDLTPGHADSRGVRYPIFSPGGEILRCFLCHSTGSPTVSADGVIQPGEPGVRCETCHGPGAAHVAAPGRGNVVNPRGLNADGLNQLCGSCHRKPAAAGAETDYRNAWNTRHQPLYLAKSQCFLKSKGEMSCLTCHPAHGGAARTGPAVCSQCHSPPKHSARTVVAGKTCESCHMPDVVPRPGLRFANHWIGVYRRGETLVPIR